MGFRSTGGCFSYRYEAVVDNETICPFGVIRVCIYFSTIDRILHIYCDKQMEFTEIDIIYDLIKADLVEKVD